MYYQIETHIKLLVLQISDHTQYLFISNTNCRKRLLCGALHRGNFVGDILSWGTSLFATGIVCLLWFGD